MLRYILLFFLLPSLSVHAGASKWVSFSNESGLIVLPAKIDGVDTFVGLDTGATTNAISQSFLDEYGQHFHRSKTAIIVGVNSKQKKKLVQNIPVELFGVSFELDDVSPMSPDYVDLLLGAGFLRHFIFQIDYPNNQLRVLTRDSIQLKKFANVKAARATGSTQPVVQVTVNSKDNVWLILDTGNTGGILVPRFIAEENGWLDNVKFIESTARGVNSISRRDTFNLEKVKIGPFELENSLISVPKEGEMIQIGRANNQINTGSNITRGKKSRGLLGYDILKHFVVTIDYRNYLVNLSLPE